MKSGIRFEQGEIVLMPFPFSDLSNVKHRPVLVLSKGEYNSIVEDFIVCGITSNLKNTDYSVLISNKDLVEGKLPVESMIKVDKIFTLEQGLVKKKIGKVSGEVFEKIKEEMFKLI